MEVAARVVSVQVGEGTTMMVAMGADTAHISGLIVKNYTSESGCFNLKPQCCYVSEFCSLS